VALLGVQLERARLATEQSFNLPRKHECENIIFHLF
jgi:hypothetical protein